MVPPPSGNMDTNNCPRWWLGRVDRENGGWRGENSAGLTFFGVDIHGPHSARAAQEFTVEADSGNVMPLHPSSLTAVDDMVSLGDMNNAALLHNLRLRYWDDDIFVRGP